MKFWKVAGGLALALSLMQAPSAKSAEPDFKEVYGLIRENLSNVSEDELNRAAVQGLVDALQPRVSILKAGEPGTSSNPPGSSPLKSSLFDGGILYLRVAQIGQGFANEVRQQFESATATNGIRGLVVDLRYAGGESYSEAANAADAFLKSERPLLQWDDHVAKSTEKPNAIAVPVVALVNVTTTQAAEALAAVLKENGIGLVIGAKTAGRALVSREFPLGNGDRLRIATAAVKLGSGAVLDEGITPDIDVQVTPENEKAWYADAFANLPPTNEGPRGVSGIAATNIDRRARLNEADLVRERRRGTNGEPIPGPAVGETERPVVRDPALARALDVLKGLAVVRKTS
jgi:hypothetical protein